MFLDFLGGPCVLRLGPSAAPPVSTCSHSVRSRAAVLSRRAFLLAPSSKVAESSEFSLNRHLQIPAPRCLQALGALSNRPHSGWYIIQSGVFEVRRRDWILLAFCSAIRAPWFEGLAARAPETKCNKALQSARASAQASGIYPKSKRRVRLRISYTTCHASRFLGVLRLSTSSSTAAGGKVCVGSTAVRQLRAKHSFGELAMLYSVRLDRKSLNRSEPLFARSSCLKSWHMPW